MSDSRVGNADADLNLISRGCDPAARAVWRRYFDVGHLTKSRLLRLVWQEQLLDTERCSAQLHQVVIALDAVTVSADRNQVVGVNGKMRVDRLREKVLDAGVCPAINLGTKSCGVTDRTQIERVVGGQESR